MKFYLIAFIGLSLTLINCEKKKLERYEAVENPANETIDINEDGIPDFQLNYTRIETKDIPVSSSTISLHIIGNETNLILEDTINLTSLFLESSDSVFIIPADTTHIWTDTSSYLLEKNWDGKNWAEYWTINSTNNKPYYVGYKLIEDSMYKIGWAKLNINQDNGAVEFELFEETTDSSLLVTYNE